MCLLLGSCQGGGRCPSLKKCSLRGSLRRSADGVGHGERACGFVGERLQLGQGRPIGETSRVETDCDSELETVDKGMIKGFAQLKSL